MDIQTEKSNLIKWLQGINDSKIIRQVSALRKSTETTVAERLSQSEKDAIDKGLKSINDGKYKSNEEVKEITRKKYPQVFK